MRLALLLIIWPSLVIGQTYAGGIQSVRSPYIIVTQQDVKLSLDQVRVTSTYLNTATKPINETLAFALPSRSTDNFKSLVILVDQQKIAYQTIQRAINNSGHDISQELKALRMPFNPIAAMHNIDASPNRDSIIAKLRAIRAIDKQEDIPTWQVSTYYYWQQEFPAQKQVVIEQMYKPLIVSQQIKLNSFASIIKMPLKMVKKMWNVVRWNLDDSTIANLRTEFEKYWPRIQDYCPNQNDYRALAQAYKGNPRKKMQLQAKELNFATDTQNFWANNISRFSLSIESPRNMYALVCWNEPLKRSNNNLYFSTTNFWPLQNINVLYVEK